MAGQDARRMDAATGHLGPWPWPERSTMGLVTDLYQLTMLRAYFQENLVGEAVFSLFARRLPPGRNYFLACGLETALRTLEEFGFTRSALDRLAGLGLFPEPFLRRLEELRFTGDVHAIPEGTPVFGNEPLLEVVAPLPEAQVVETLLLNQVHFQTVAASKAVRVVAAARGRTVVDFGLRRMHGAEAGVMAARAFYVAGVDATSNVLAGLTWGIPVSGTMAHSFVQAHESELAAFRAFARSYPEAVLLIDTYDTLEGARNVVRLAGELGSGFQIRGVRLDSGDLGTLSREVRRILDAAGLAEVKVFASGGLDEHEIDRLVSGGAPIDGFGVGTAMGVSADAPALDMAYKLVAYGGRGRIKLSPGKSLLPGRKQVFRIERDGVAQQDLLGGFDEVAPGRPLLRPMMCRGQRTPEGQKSLEEARANAILEVARLPAPLRGLDAVALPYPVQPTSALLQARDRARSDAALASRA